MSTFSRREQPPLFYPTIDYDARMASAIVGLELQAHINYTATVNKWNVARQTLAKRYIGETGTVQEANSYARQKLTNAQEEVLVGHIRRLEDRDLPLTPQMLREYC